MHSYLEFEKPVADMQGKIRELVDMSEGDENVDLSGEIEKLQKRSDEMLADLYRKLTPWHKALVARHPDRPHFIDYVQQLITEYTPLSGDRHFGEDAAIQAGFGRFDGSPVAVIGHEKGNDTQSRVKHNFGSARPEGYRKAVRVMELAQRYQMPVISLIDTAGAYPGVGAEARGQAEAIARSTEFCLNLKAPIIAIIIGEGGSGGAIAIATANRVLMLEHTIYSVISPEGGASILWRDASKAKEVAAAMKITAQDLLEYGIIDEIVSEPSGGAHRDHEKMITDTGNAIRENLKSLSELTADELKSSRQEKFLAIGRNLM